MLAMTPMSIAAAMSARRHGDAHQARSRRRRRPPDREEDPESHDQQDHALHGELLDPAEKVLDRDADDGSEGDEHPHPDDRRRHHGGDEDAPRHAQRSGDQRRVDAQSGDQPAQRHPHPPGRPHPSRHPLEVALLVKPLSQRGQSVLPDQSRPAVSHDRAGHAGKHGQGDEHQRIEAARGDEESGGEEHDLPRRKRERDPGLFGEEEATEQHDGDNTVQALEKVQGVVLVVLPDARGSQPTPPHLTMTGLGRSFVAEFRQIFVDLDDVHEHLSRFAPLVRADDAVLGELVDEPSRARVADVHLALQQ